MKKSPLISTILVKGDHNIHNHDFLFIPVVVYSLYVIILVKEIKDSLHLLDRFLVSKFYQFCGIIVISASTIGIPAFSRASRTALKLSGSVITS